MLVLSPRYLVNSRGPIDAPVNLHVNRWTNVARVSRASKSVIGGNFSQVRVCVRERYVAYVADYLRR